MKKALLITLILSASLTYGQKVYRTFKDTRVINGHSIETLDQHEMDIRISHRFGDFAGDNGGVSTFYGLDNAADVRIAVEYGVTNNLNVGFGRSKGAEPYRQLLDGYVKYGVLEQQQSGMPISLTVLGTSSYATQEASTSPNSPVSFREGAHRFAYCAELLIARKFSDRFSLQIMPAYVHRNYVAFEDENGTFSLGGAFNLKVSKLLGLIGEYHYVMPHNRTTNISKYYDAIGLGLEFDTGGHVFQLNFTNSRGLGETQFLPYTSSNLSDGQFRIGFTISRVFKLKRKDHSEH